MMARAASDTPAADPHIPVLLEAILTAVAPVTGTWLDGTFGAGGYTRGLLSAGADRVIGVDRDPMVFRMAQDWAGDYGDRLILVEGTFSDLDRHAAGVGYPALDGVVLDLGVSSMQLDQAERGFSFMRDGPLDMRMGHDGPSAADVVNQLDEKGLADIIFRLGEESGARRVARAVVRRRLESPFKTTLDLAEVVEVALGGRRGKRTHPATKTFQALRMFLNDELGELGRALVAAERVLKAGGHLVIVTFHSLEDRIVKTFMRRRAGLQGGGSRHAPEREAGAPPSFELISRKAVSVSDEETSENPRARSSRLRAAVRTSAPAWGGAG